MQMSRIDQALAGGRIRYRVDGPIGLGSHGPVQRGCAERLGATPVALRPFPAPTGPERDELRRRAELLATIGHPALCPVVDIIEVDAGQVVVASLLGSHGSLADRLVLGHVAVDEAAPLVALLADGLSRAHAAGLRHGGISSANVVFSDRGPMLTDLAIPRSGASTNDDRRALAEIAGGLIDPDDRSPSAQAYRGACGQLHDGTVTLPEFIHRVAAVPLSPPPPSEAAPARGDEMAGVEDRSSVGWPATTGLVVAGAATLGVTIGLLTTAML